MKLPATAVTRSLCRCTIVRHRIPARPLIYTLVIAAGLLLYYTTWYNPPTPLMVSQSPHSFDHTVKNIRKAVKSNNFRIIRESHEPGLHTIYFCNFSVAYQAIKKDERIGFALPCRISIIKKQDKVVVTTLNPRKVEKFTRIRLGGLCTRIKESISNILDEALI